MKCQCSRSSPLNGNVACCFCSGVRLSRNFAAASDIADADRSAAIIEPAIRTTSAAIARTKREVMRFMPRF